MTVPLKQKVLSSTVFTLSNTLPTFNKIDKFTIKAKLKKLAIQFVKSLI